MVKLPLLSLLIAFSVAGAGAFAQDKPAAPATAPAGAVKSEVDRELKNLTSDEFAEREAALARLQTVIAEQLKQRAAIQELLSTLQADLARQQAALAVVSDEEAVAQITGLLELERGLTSWTIQTMAEPVERRKKLLDWGLTKENVTLLARLYAPSNRTRLEAIKQLAKVDDAAGGASWTLARLINDRSTPVRAAAMAAAWSRKPSPDVVNALWYRAIEGPLSRDGGNMHTMIFEAEMMSGMLKVDFPGGEPMQFGDEDESRFFFDAQLAGDVLINMDSELVAAKVKSLVADRLKAGKTLALGDNPEWALVGHRLVEVYKVKEAIPLLAATALGADTDFMGGDMNGRPFMWSRRTVAIGTLLTLIGKDPGDFELFRARNGGDSRGWMWAGEMDQQAMMQGNLSDAGPVRAFYAFWKEHHAEYGVKETPSNAHVPPPPGARGGRGRGFGRPMPVPAPEVDPAIDLPAQQEPAVDQPMILPIRPKG